MNIIDRIVLYFCFGAVIALSLTEYLSHGA